MNTKVEICCGSYYDAIQAYNGGAKRIELNSALHLGGLTPDTSTLNLIKEETDLEVICMVRPRGAGFFYSELDYKVMLKQCEDLLINGADGIAFGFLNEDYSIDKDRSREFVRLIKSYNKTAVFHRAFDCVKEVDNSINDLIDIGIDRILTSGLRNKAIDGIDTLKYLQNTYGEKIELLIGSGVNHNNAKQIIEYTSISQIHSSCKEWKKDITTSSDEVSYAYNDGEYKDCYDVVACEFVEKLVKSIL